MAKCISLDAVRDNCDRAHVLPDCLCTEIMVEDMHIDAGISSACMYAHVMHTFLSLLEPYAVIITSHMLSWQSNL